MRRGRPLRGRGRGAAAAPRRDPPRISRSISAFVQDAVAQTSEIAWTRRRRRFALLLNRFRWEDAPAAERQGRPFERVQARARRRRRAPRAGQRRRSRRPRPRARVLALAFDPGEEGAGTLRLVLAGDGEIALEVECLDLTLTDVTRPYEAVSGRAPSHDLAEEDGGGGA